MKPENRLPTQSDRRARFSGGFSLVEILVGMGIGMIGIVVIMQVFTLSEGQRRTTSSGGDAQTSGAIAMSSLERDIRQAGYGIASLNLLGCDLLQPNGITVPVIAPVSINPAIIPAGDANSDIVAVVYGNANAAAEGDFINGHPAGTPPAMTTYSVRTPTNFTLNDFVIAEPPARPAPCNLTLTQINAAAGATTVSVNAGHPTSASQGVLYNLGQRPRILVYAVRGGNLTVCDYTATDCSAVGSIANSTVWSPIAENIVSLRAQYGRDTTAPMDGVADVYDQTIPVTVPAGCGWARASALRLALVARSGQYDKDDITTAAPNWAGAAGNPIDLSGDTNWRHYRYKMFQTVVPLRNVAWLGALAGC